MSLPPLSPGDMAPRFAAPTRDNPQFHISTVTGRYVLLAFMPRDPAAQAAALAAFEPHRPRFDDVAFTAFFVATDPATIAEAQDRPPGQRWFFDPQGEVSRLHGARAPDGSDAPIWLLLDPMRRVLDRAPLDQAEAFLARLAALPAPAKHSGALLTAPVLIVPRVFDLDLCRRLVALYDAEGGQRSGVMRDVDGRTVGVMDAMKSRRDLVLGDPALRKELARKLEVSLLPEIRKVFQFQATRLERYLLACYDAAERGRFAPHRDNETLGTAHRRFAVSINLNTEEYEGGDLRFPEFGPRTYRPPTGGAAVFSCSLQHEATPVTRGRRFAFLPFLFDEAGQGIRERNLAFLETSPARQPADP